MPHLHEKYRCSKVFSVFVPKLRNEKKRCFALPQIAFVKSKKKNKKPLANASGFLWCRRRDLNPHAREGNRF